MFRRLGLLLAAFAFFTIAGGHWAVLQSIAWAQMLRDYSAETSLSVALEKTFSGKYPCGMCRKIADARKDESKKAPAILTEKKSAEFLAAATVTLPSPDHARIVYPRFLPLPPDARTPEPAVPVPIG